MIYSGLDSDLDKAGAAGPGSYLKRPIVVILSSTHFDYLDQSQECKAIFGS